MPLLERAQHIVLHPRTTWDAIAAEPAGIARLYGGYLMILAALPAVCGFIGMSLVGVNIGGLGHTLRVPLLTGLVNAVVSYGISLAGVFVLALVVDALAPVFGGVRDKGQALKLVVYASTAALLGGVFALLPALAALGLIPSLYSIYLLYTGLPVLMKNPPERALGYTASVLAAGLVLSLLLGALGALLAPGLMPNTAAALNSRAAGTAAGNLAPLPSQLQAAAPPDGGAAAEAAALTGALGTALGAGSEPLQGSVSLQSLKAALPVTLAGLPRTGLTVQDGAALGLPTQQASAEYGRDGQQVSLDLIDMGSLAAVARVAALTQGEQESNGQVERHWQQDGRALQEQYETDGSRAELQVLLKNGVAVRLLGEPMPIEELRGLLAQMDLNALEQLPRTPQ